MPIQPTFRNAPLRNARRFRASYPVNRPTVGQAFDIEVTRETNGWSIQIPEINASTHATRRETVELAARECIATRTGIPIGYVAIIVRDS